MYLHTSPEEIPYGDLHNTKANINFFFLNQSFWLLNVVHLLRNVSGIQNTHYK